MRGDGEQESGRKDRLRGNPDGDPQLAVGGLGQLGGSGRDLAILPGVPRGPGLT